MATSAGRRSLASELGKFSEEELVPNEQVIVTLTNWQLH
jgi:hypothetical protein